MSEYTAENIVALEGLEPVRKRPGMYVGDSGEYGLHQLVYEIIDNSVDEAVAGFCKKIKVRLNEDSIVEIEDDGRGIPIDIHPQFKLPAAQITATKLHAGGKFSNDVYKFSGGLHGVGLSVVNALSEWLILEIWRDGKYYKQRFERAKAEKPEIIDFKESKTGTKVTFKPDHEIFKSIIFKPKKIRKRILDLSYLIPRVDFIFEYIDENNEKKKEVFRSEKGLKDFLDNSVQVKFIPPIEFKGEYQGIEVEGIFTYSNVPETIISFANSIRTINGGFHVSGLKMAVTKTLQSFIDKRKISIPKKVQLKGEDFRNSLFAILHVKIPDPEFEGQTKVKLGTREAQTAVYNIAQRAFQEYLTRHTKEGEKLVKLSIESAQTRKEIEKKTKKLKKSGKLSLPGKLADCLSKNPEERELFIVEGDSAGGSVKQGRFKEFQAVLPLRGKFSNIEKTNMRALLANETVFTIISALGILNQDLKTVDYSKLRYGKIIFLTDADCDGQHIRSLLLTLFYRMFRKLIEDGKVYVAQPPLYRLVDKKKAVYVRDDKELEKTLKRIKKDVTVQRFKGLGEMNPEQLRETTLDPEKRQLLQVTIEDFEEAEEYVQSLLGKDSEPRKKLLIEKAEEADNIDLVG